MALLSSTAPFMQLCALVLLITSFLLLSTPCNANPNPEVNALIDVKKMILRDPSNALQSWEPFSLDPCNWRHVTCDGEGHVQTLKLANQKLDGVLSPKIADLQSLETLDLSHNSFSMILPTTLGNLKKLRILDLSHNQFSGTIPASLGQIRYLRLLYLQFNKLEGRVPTDGSLSSFGYMSFEGNPELCGPVVRRECPRRSLDP